MGDHQLSPSPCSPSNGCSSGLGSDTSFYSPLSNQKMVQNVSRQLYYEKSEDSVIENYLQSDMVNSPLMNGKSHSSTQVDLLQDESNTDQESVSKATDTAGKKVDTVVKSFSQLDLKQSNQIDSKTAQAKSVEDLWKFVDGMMQGSPSTSNVGTYYSFSPSSLHAAIFQPRAITNQPSIPPSFQPRPMHETYAMNNYQAWSNLAQLQGLNMPEGTVREALQSRHLSRSFSHPAANGAVDCTGPTMPKFRQNYPFPKHILEAVSTPKTVCGSRDTTQATSQDVRYEIYAAASPKPCTPESSNAMYMLSTMSNSTSTTAGSQDFLTTMVSDSSMYQADRSSGVAFDQLVPNMSTNTATSPSPISYPVIEAPHFSRKVFVGGLPPDIDEEEITLAFRRFGPLVVDWPHKADSKSYFPPKGYCFLLFQDEMSVQTLISSCLIDDSKLYWCVSSPTMKDKPVQIRPWNIADSDFVLDGTQPLDPRKTIFVGGVPRPLRAVELAMIMERLYGGVCYAGIDTDPELKYPKGAGRVAFSNQQSYIAAISARFVQLQHSDIDKRVEVKPYVLDDQLCDECQGTRCAGRYAPFFCANVTCLQYYCELCWAQIHARPGREYHKPLVKEGTERPRSLPFRWY